MTRGPTFKPVFPESNLELSCQREANPNFSTQGRSSSPSRNGGKRSVSLLFANITSWSVKASAYILQQPHDIVLLAEHHQPPDKLACLQESFAKQGWQCKAEAALLNAEETGTSGGVAVAVKKHLGPFWPVEVGNHRWTYAMVRFHKFTLTVVSAYFPVIGFRHHSSQQVQSELAAFLGTLAGPWLLLADFNDSPEAVATSGFVQQVKGKLLSPGAATLTSGGILDFALTSRDLEGGLQLEVETQVPFAPHFALSVQLRADLAVQEVPTLHRVDKIPALPGPRMPWKHFEVAPGEVEIALPGEKAHSPSTIAFAAWSCQAEAYLMSVSTEQYTAGRGRIIRISQQPRVPPTVPEAVWDSSNLTFWATLQRLVKAARSNSSDTTLKTGFFRMIADKAARTANFWVGSANAKLSLLGLQYALRILPVATDTLAEAVQVTLQQQLKHQFQARRKALQQHFEKTTSSLKAMRTSKSSPRRQSGLLTLSR